MTTQPEVSLTGRAPTEPADFYVIDAKAATFVQKVVGTVSAYGACLTAEVAVDGTHGSHATAIRAIVSGESGASISHVVPISIETYITDAPVGVHTMMRFNTNAALDTPDFWFMSSKQACAYSDSAAAKTSTVAGGILVKVTGANLLTTLGWIRVHQEV